MLQFSLRTMLIAICVISIVLFIARLIPNQVSILLFGAMPAPVLTAMAVRWRRLRRFSVAAVLVLAWSGFYVVSIGPVAGMGLWLGLERNRLFHSCFDGFYAPLIWAYQRPSLTWPIEWYIDFWQHLALRLR